MKTLFILITMTLLSTSATANPLSVFFGTARSKFADSKGVYSIQMDPTTGALLGTPQPVAELDSPGFLTLHPILPVLYALASAEDGQASIMNSFSIGSENGTAALTPINSVKTGCKKATYIDVDKEGKLLVSVQYGEGTVAVFPLNEDGSLQGPSQVISHTAASKSHPTRQEAPHPHSAVFDPSGQFVLVPDLGADIVYVYKVNYTEGTLSLHAKIKSAQGAGPRHMKFSADARHAYVINELSLTIDTYQWNAETGSLDHLSTVAALPEDRRNKDISHTASEIQIHPNGNFIYTAIRGQDCLSVFSVDPVSGQPSLLQVIPAEVEWPRHFSLDPSGHFLVCSGQFSHNATVFSIDPETGLLVHLPHPAVTVPGPICVLFFQ